MYDLRFHDTELSWLIGSGVIIDKNLIGQLRDWLTYAIYIEKETHLPWPIISYMAYDENQ